MDKKIRISLDINTELGNIQSKMSQLQQQLNKVQLNGLSGRALVSDFDNIQNRIGKLQELADRPLTVKSDFSKAEKETLSIQTAIKKLTKEVEQLQTASNKKKLELLPNDQKQKIEKANSALSTYEKSINKTIGKTNELKKAEKDLTSIQEELSREQKKSLTSQSAIEAKTTNLENVKKQLREANKLKQATAEAYKQKGWSTEVTGRKYQSSTKVDVDGQKVALKDITEKVIRLKEEETKLTNDLNNLTTSEKINEINQRLKVQNETVDTLTAQWKELNLAEKSKAFNTLKEAAQQLGISLEGIGGVDDVETLINRFQQLEKNGIDAVDTALRQLKTEIKSTTPSLDQISDKVNQAGDEFDLASQRVQEFASLKSQVLSFFTITGAIQLFQRAVQSAFETVKELDEAMTEIAVVSDFSVGDMWKQLPKFTEQANQLGKSIRDVYSATTLYVQQGLDLNNSLKLANETLKMAAVAGMDSKDATDAMTSALRGFNMELNETSAQKINDVYSELAAISAADTQEISTAMSKVASLAHNVNMEFETTASFLTQGIEATREAPETIGTALKTVIARFAEVKSLVTKGQLTGADEEGEVINVNKVQTALRSAGISMTAFLKGEEGLDQVLLKLSSRWNDLDVLTQRYIATMAAGSRQQSRFIAMMDNYAKTTEFVNSAYNSAGSGQRQFEKTLESLAAKLTKLKNAWDEFAMGLTNNVIIKGAIDTLTVLLTAINKLIDGLSGGQGLIKSVMTLGAVWGGLKLGGNLVDKALASNWVQNKIKLTKGDSETVANIRGTNTERTSYYQKGVNMANEFQRGFQSFKASDRKSGFFLENVLGIDTKNNQIKKELAKNVEDIKQDIAGSQEDYTMGYIAVPDDFDDQLTELDKKYKKNAISAEEYENSLVSLGASQESAKARLGAFDKEQKKVQVNTQKLGTATTVVGGAFMALAGIFSMFGEKGQKVASVLATIGGVLVVIGQLIPVIAKYGPKILSTITTLASAHPVLAAIVVAVGALVAAFAAVNANSPEKKLEKLKENADKAKEAVEKASQAYDELSNKKTTLEELNTKMSSLTKGTLEWKQALAQVNNEIINLQSQYSNLQVSVDENGKLSITNWDEVLKQQVQYLENATSRSTVASIIENNSQRDIDIQKVQKDKDLTTEQKNSQIAALKINNDVKNKALLATLTNDLIKNDKNGGTDTNVIKALNNLAFTITKTNHDQASGKTYQSNLIDSLKTSAEDTYFGKTKGTLKKMYEEEFGKGSAEGLSKSELKQALVDLKTEQKYQQTVESVINWDNQQKQALGILSGDSDFTISNLMKNSNGETIDVNNLLNLTDEQKQKMATDLKTTVDDLTTQLDTAAQQMQQKLIGMQAEFSKAGIENFNSYGYNIAQSIYNQISQIDNEELKKKYTEIFEQLSNEELTYLGTLDLSNMSDLIDGMEYLQSLGKSDEEIKSWWDTAIKGANTYIKSVEEAGAVTDKLHAKLASVDEVESRFTEGSASSEDVQAAMQAGVELEGYLSRTANGWQLSEEKAKEASQAIKKNAAEQAQAVKESTEQQIESYKKLVGDNNTEVGILSSFDKDKGTYESGEITDVQTATKVANELGLAVQGEKETTEEFIARTQEAYENIVSMLNNSSSILQTVTQEAAYASAVSMTAAEAYGALYNKDGLSEEDKITIVWAAQNEAVEAGADLTDLQAMQTLLEENNNRLKENKDIAAAVTSQNAKMNIGLKEIIDSYSDWTPLIDESTGLIKIGAVEDAAAFNKLKTSVNKMLNTSIDLSDSFWDNAENISNLKAAAEGSIEALGRLQKAAAVDYLQQLDFSNYGTELKAEAESGVQSFIDYLNSIELPKLEVGQVLDDETFINKFNEMARIANLDSQQIQEAAKAMGFNVEFTMAKQTRKIPKITTTKKVTKRNLLGMATEWEESSKITGYDSVTDEFPVVKTLTASGSGGGGISTTNSTDAASTGSSGGSSSSEKKESTWENPYDKLYNLTEEINEALRQREKLEREYDRILERRGSTFQELRKNYNSQLQSLQKEIALQNQLRAGRLAQLNALSSETYKGQDSDGNELIKSFADWGVTKYGSYNPNTGLLKIDWDAIDAVKDENLGSAIEAYISRLEELQGQIEDIDTQIEDFQDKVTELQKEGMQDYLDFEQKVYDAIVNQQQQLIDNYQDLSDKINDSNSKILDSIQRSIDLQRQIRDNTKTEEDINEKEARLAYLRQDTSNGNLLEIKQLEEELADDRQNYEDNLIDQQLERLTQQNDDAQTARERQIDLMQKQLDYASKNGDFWNQTYDLLTSAFTESGEINLASQVWELLKKDEGWKGMSKFGQLNWQEEISKAILAASHGYANWNMYKAKEIDKNLVTSNGISLHYNGSNWVDSKGNIYNGVDYDSKIGGFTYSGMTKAPTPSGGGSSSSSGGKGAFSIGSRVKADPNAIIYADSYGGGGGSQYYKNDPIYTILDENNGYYLTRYHGVSGGYTGWFRKKDLTPYKTGGIADFTGPAWLDGTKSNPELILNARDTENFIALKDILSSIMDRKGLQNNTQSVGDMYFNIDINVDKISNDYDVENLSKKIKQELADSAMYRNVNLVNFIR